MQASATAGQPHLHIHVPLAAPGHQHQSDNGFIRQNEIKPIFEPETPGKENWPMQPATGNDCKGKWQPNSGQVQTQPETSTQVTKKVAEFRSTLHPRLVIRLMKYNPSLCQWGGGVLPKMSREGGMVHQTWKGRQGTTQISFCQPACIQTTKYSGNHEIFAKCQTS